LCFCIAFCNLTVIWELSRIRPHGRVLVRRVSRSTVNSRTVAERFQTPEEVAFAKLMAIICIIFVACWAPQMVRESRCSDTFLIVVPDIDPSGSVLEKLNVRQEIRKIGQFPDVRLFHAGSLRVCCATLHRKKAKCHAYFFNVNTNAYFRYFASSFLHYLVLPLCKF
jgi:hypothetical protein